MTADSSESEAVLASYWEAQAGVGLIGAAALLALLIVYRRMRSKVLGLGVIQEALHAFARVAAT